MRRLYILAWGSLLLAVVTFVWDRPKATHAYGKGLLVDKSWLVTSNSPLTPAEHRRPPDQTFLTYPEWFLVFGPAEQAKFFQHDTSTKFPFMVHVFQIWGSYRVVYDQIRDNYPFNTGYHVMIVVIGVSSTAEFGLKSVYETVVGRLTDLKSGEMTDEDRFNAKFAQDYVTFIETSPWYEFDFKSRLKAFWTETPLFGPHPLRKWERKYILTTELAVKTVYGWLIGLGTRSAYERPILKTAVVADHLPPGIESRLPDLETIQKQPEGTAVFLLPRYAPFSTNACQLAMEGVHFKEVAGNTSAILITVLAPRQWTGESPDWARLFEQPIPTEPETKRVALATPVNRLHQTLRSLVNQKIEIEHVYDF